MVEKHHGTKNRIDKIYKALFLCNKSLSELNYLSNIVYTDDETDLLSNYSFEFYKTTLQYCHNAEYCKMFEDGSDDEPQLSSIVKLNKFLFNKLGDDFYASFKINKHFLESIMSSDLYKRQIDFRDKIEQSLSLSYQEVQEGLKHLLIIKEVLGNCTSYFKINFDIRIPNPDTRTVDFIMDYSVFRKFYYENFMKLLD